MPEYCRKPPQLAVRTPPDESSNTRELSSKSAMQNKLRVGLLIDSSWLPAWAFRSLEQVANLDCAEICLVIQNRAGRVGRICGSTPTQEQNIAYRLLDKWDRAFFRRGPDAFMLRDAKELLSKLPVITVETAEGTRSGYFSAPDIAQIKRYRLDILIKMGFEHLRGEILTAARYGVWAHYHGDPRTVRSNLPGFWEVSECIPKTGCILYVLENDQSFGRILYRSSVPTFSFSPYRNRMCCYWRSSVLLARQVKLLHRLGEKGFLAEVARYNAPFEPYDRRTYNSESPSALAWACLRIAWQAARELFLRATCRGVWHLLVDTSTTQSLEIPSFKKITPPKDRFWADPHLIQKDGTNYVFVEEYVYRARKGRISVIEIDSNGMNGAPIPVLSRDYHLSYPFVFEHEGTYFMVPESSDNSTIDIYECVKFPMEWKFQMTLMSNVKAVDTTIFHHEGTWWLFTGITEHEGAFPAVELFLFYSNKLLTTQWKPHVLNPIVSDATASRPAGRLFTAHGRIYRPSQDCSRRYGYAIHINEVQCLTPSQYREHPVAKIEPNWDRGTIATHTYSSGEGLTIIDGFSIRPKILGNAPRPTGRLGRTDRMSPIVGMEESN